MLSTSGRIFRVLANYFHFLCIIKINYNAMVFSLLHFSPQPDSDGFCG